MQNLQEPDTTKVNEPAAAAGSTRHAKDPRTNELLIQKVLEIEKDADKVYEKGVHEAEQLPIHADQEAQAMLEKSRQTAQAEAAQMVDKAKVQQQSADIQAEAEKNIQHIETLASSNFNRAVSYVIARVIGRE